MPRSSSRLRARSPRNATKQAPPLTRPPVYGMTKGDDSRGSPVGAEGRRSRGGLGLQGFVILGTALGSRVAAWERTRRRLGQYVPSTNSITMSSLTRNVRPSRSWITRFFVPTGGGSNRTMTLSMKAFCCFGVILSKWFRVTAVSSGISPSAHHWAIFENTRLTM